LRDPEVKQKERHSYESGFFSRVEKHCFLCNKVADFSKSWGEKIKIPSLDFKYQKLKNVKGKK
jgi:hypothetical protein